MRGSFISITYVLSFEPLPLFTTSQLTVLTMKKTTMSLSDFKNRLRIRVQEYTDKEGNKYYVLTDLKHNLPLCTHNHSSQETAMQCDTIQQLIKSLST